MLKVVHLMTLNTYYLQGSSKTLYIFIFLENQNLISKIGIYKENIFSD